MTEKIEISPAELAEIVKAQVAEALAAERAQGSPKAVEPPQPDPVVLMRDKERAEFRERMATEGAKWAALADEALEAADHEMANPYSTVVGQLSVSLPSRDGLNQSPPDRLGVAAALLEHRAQTDEAFGAAANNWFGLGLGDLYRRPGVFRALLEQRARRHPKIEAETTQTTENTMEKI